tara:strand:+ start:1145 stop:1543 length:399 start_codon:yes stop_codon:yes gene_type:complete
MLKTRPLTDLEEFEVAFEQADLDDTERQIIDYIRFIGIFTQPEIVKALNLNAKPPPLSRICDACRKIGGEMPEHFSLVRQWSKQISKDNVRWDGDLICSNTFNIDGISLSPESGTCQFHHFAVHKELFTGLD